MELIWNERNGARVVYCGVAQALVEGEVPQLPDRPADTILSATGDVALLGLETAEGCVRMGGEIRLQLICQDASGVFAFTSRAPSGIRCRPRGWPRGCRYEAFPPCNPWRSS